MATKTPPINYLSTEFLAIARWAQEEITRLRQENDADKNPVETATLRGQIRGLKSLLGLPTKAAREREAGSVGDDSFGG